MCACERAEARIDLGAVRRNIRALKDINKDTGLMAVVKADGYGHGAVEVARAVSDFVCGYGVATAGEAAELRENGITKPIFVLGYTFPGDYERIIASDIRPAVFDYATACGLSKAAVKMKKAVRIHIAVDTGMGRIGYFPDYGAMDEIISISGLPGVMIEGIFTHFSTSDEADKAYTRMQLEKFNGFVDELSRRGLYIPVKHCANSAAVMEMPQAALTLSRVGIAMYGLYPSAEVKRNRVALEPAMSIKSHVVFVKSVPAGTSISYGRTFVTECPSTIATIPVGYGDGYPRSLSNRGYVLIRGKKAPITGRVCMDQFMVDVTDIDGVETGDEVTLVGTDGDESICVEELSELAGSFNYEFVCGIGKRVPRVYIG